jgi:hypothetical protein
VSPTIWAAIISGGWAATVAGIGFYYNQATAKAAAQATRANALAALDAAHDAELWEKKSEAYVEAITKINDRRTDRNDLVPIPRDDDELEDRWQRTRPPEDEEGKKLPQD